MAVSLLIRQTRLACSMFHWALSVMFPCCSFACPLETNGQSVSQSSHRLRSLLAHYVPVECCPPVFFARKLFHPDVENTFAGMNMTSYRLNFMVPPAGTAIATTLPVTLKQMSQLR